MTPNAAQRTLDWFRNRLGCFTGSNLGKLMQLGRDDIFGKTAKAYLYRIAAERMMNPAIVDDDDMFAAYLGQVDVTTKAMRWGTEQEANARELYTKITGNKVVEVGSCHHPYIPHFACSPDGFYYDEMKPERYVIEIKSPSQATYVEYAAAIRDNDSLKAVNPDYYWQTQGEMMCLNADWCDFVVYCPWQAEPMHIVKLYPDIEAQARISERIVEAEKLIEEITSKIKRNGRTYEIRAGRTQG